MKNRNTIKLENNFQRVVIAPAFGGRIVAWDTKVTGDWLPILKNIADKEYDVSAPEKGGIFPLVPFSNRIENGHFMFQGKSISLSPHPAVSPHAMHGHGCIAQWDVIQVTDNQVVLEYKHTAGEWPWHYTARQLISISDKGLECELSVTNRSGDGMPVGIGFHPFFVNPSDAVVYFDAGQAWPFGPKTLPLEAVQIKPEWDTRRGYAVKDNPLSLGYSDWKQEALIKWPASNLSVSVQCCENLDHLILHIPPHCDYWCLEPVSHVTDAFNLAERGTPHTGHQVLPPKETMSAVSRYTVFCQ